MSEKKKPGPQLGIGKRARPVKTGNGQGESHSLSNEIQEKITKYLRAGNFRTTAAERAGVPLRTFSEWMKRGADGDEFFRAFRQAVLMAEKEAEAHAVSLVMKAAENDPKHAEWWLSHRFPERWADQERKRIRAEIKQQKLEVSVDLGHVTLEDVRKVLGDGARANLGTGSVGAENLLGLETSDLDA